MIAAGSRSHRDSAARFARLELGALVEAIDFDHLRSIHSEAAMLARRRGFQMKNSKFRTIASGPAGRTRCVGIAQPVFAQLVAQRPDADAQQLRSTGPVLVDL